MSFSRLLFPYPLGQGRIPRPGLGKLRPYVSPERFRHKAFPFPPTADLDPTGSELDRPTGGLDVTTARLNGNCGEPNQVTTGRNLTLNELLGGLGGSSPELRGISPGLDRDRQWAETERHP